MIDQIELRFKTEKKTSHERPKNTHLGTIPKEEMQKFVQSLLLKNLMN
jgi:hypothetical protein